LCLLALLAEERRTRWKLLWTLAGLLAFAGALFTKEIAIITPALVVCVFWYRKVPLRRYVVLVPLGAIAGIYLLLRHRTVSLHLSFSPGLLTLFYAKEFPVVLLHYVSLILWPWNLHAHPLLPHLSHFWWVYVSSWTGLLIYLAARRNRVGLFCLAWFILNLLPTTLAMISGNFMLDHWAYQANLAVLLPLAIFFTWTAEHRSELLRFAGRAGFFGLIIFWAFLVQLNVRLQNTDEKLFKWALRFTTSNPIKSNLGIVLLKNGRAAEALPYLEEVHAVYPEDLNNTHALFVAYERLGDRARAERLRSALRRLAAGNRPQQNGPQQ